MLKEIRFTSLIDTIEIRTSADNIINYNELEEGAYDFADITRYEKKANMCNVKINIHTLYGEGNTNTMEEFKEKLWRVYGMIGVIDTSNVDVSRIDIAYDTNDLDFTKDYKLIKLIFDLMTGKNKRSSKWATFDLNAFENSTLKESNSRREFEIYNKALESKGRHLYDTRLEDRHKQLKVKIFSDFTTRDKAIQRIQEMDKHLTTVEHYVIEGLKKCWDRDMKENKKYSNFSVFVQVYMDFIYTDNILKAIYKHSGLKGNYKDWLRKYRKNHTMEFYSLKDIQRVQKALLDSSKQWYEIKRITKKGKRVS